MLDFQRLAPRARPPNASEPLDSAAEREWIERRIATALFGLLVVAINLLEGGAANTAAILSFAVAWGVLLRRIDPSDWVPRIDVFLCLMLAAFLVRGSLPPSGLATTPFSAKVASNVVLLVGLYGLVLLASARARFDDLLWILVAGAVANASISLVLHLTGSNPGRMVFIGHAGNPIPGAGGLAAGVVAGSILLWRSVRSRELWRSVVLGIGLSAMCAAVYLSGSRGPIMSLIIALAVAPLLTRHRSWQLIFLFALVTWAVVTAAVMLEGPLHDGLCQITSLACRPSQRQGAWQESLQLIAAHPLMGVGSQFRFAGPLFVHPHNGLIGIAVFYGLPILAVFIAFLARAAIRITQLSGADERLFNCGLFVFALGYMGSDLSDPLRFVSTHYLFLWAPIFFAAAAAQPMRSRMRKTGQLPSSVTTRDTLNAPVPCAHRDRSPDR